MNGGQSAIMHEEVDWFAVWLSVLAFAGMVKWRWDIVPVVLGAGLLGLVHELVSSSSGVQ